MIKLWGKARRSTAIGVVSVSAIVALVATVAVVSTGYTAQHVDLADGAVWVSNNQQQAIGRANTEVLEINSVVDAQSADLEVIQHGDSILLFDRSESSIDVVDPALSEVAESVALPPDQPEVYFAGDNVVVLEHGTGELWIRSYADFLNFDSESPASLSLGADAIVSVDEDGLLFGYSPATSLLFRVNAAISDTAESSENLELDPTADLSITSVAGQWAILDSDTELLHMDGREVDLTGLIDGGNGVVLQAASAGGERVLIGYSNGVLSVPLSGAAAVGLATGQSGIAAAPLRLGDCEYAAWSSGQNWRRCPTDAGEGVILQLEEMQANAQLAYSVNGSRAVLNDRLSGRTWDVQGDGALIDNWNQLITADDEEPEVQQNLLDVEPEIDKVQQPPVAVDDTFGARPGRATVLPVLLNDYDANGDVLVIEELPTIDAAIGRIDRINERQQIQITLESGASGQVSFSYTISDGRGGSATATVTVEIRTDSENSPPQQMRATKFTVQTAGRISNQVLGDWVDPDGDPFYLTSASTAAPDVVSYKPGGDLVFSDSGEGGDLKVVTLVVSDGISESSGSVSVSVKAAGEVPIEADPFVVLAYAGKEITVSPLIHTRGGNGNIRLNSVPAKTGAQVLPSYETGTFRFSSEEVRSHNLEYVVTDGNLSYTATVRIDVVAPPDANTSPITVPKTVFVQTLQNERIDIAGTDVDPAGGVLLVTEIMNLRSGSGVRAEILEQRLVRVSLEAPLDDGPVTFNYRISNGLADAVGVITVVEIPAPSRLQAPIANDDSVTVRVGQAVDIQVLLNDEHPDGLELSLVPKLAQDLPDDSGLLFTSGDVLRYLAPERTGNFTAAYQVAGPDGQSATAIVNIAVRELDVSSNNPPVPPTVTARVLAGDTVRIQVPLTAADPDGDSVQLLGQATNPSKGAVIEVDSNTFVYQAGEYSAGTDSFTYTLIDSLGARANGEISIGISPRLEGARNPVAIIDEVTVKPGITVSVQVLANDSDPDGSRLSVVSVEPNDEQTVAEIDGDVVDVTPPETPGDYGIIYVIENETGGTSQNFIRVTVDPDAEPAYPIATDSVLTLSDVLDRNRVTVDVLAGVFFADGDPRTLSLAIYPGFDDVASVTSDKRIEVSVGDSGQIIPFRVTNPADPTVFSYAFISVPGYNDALPQIDRRANKLSVNSESTLVIDLNDYIIAVGENPVRLTDSSTVLATHSDGSELVRDEDTLVYTSAEKYFGPASISFEVTDGTSATDPEGRTAILVLPIEVLPRDNQAPVFGGAVIDFEPGQEKEIDLLKLTTYPYPDDLDELAYSVLSPLPEGFSYSLDGTLLTLVASSNSLSGTRTSISLGVRDDLSEGKSGRIELSVVPSTRPLVSPASDLAIAQRGETTVVDVLANDVSTNPFPGSSLKVIDIRGLGGDSIPAGISIVPSGDNRTLTVTVSSEAAPGDVNLQYLVADATNDASRYVWGSVVISIQDVPDAISNLSPSGFGDKTIMMRWNAGPANNSAITSYRVTTRIDGTLVNTTDCPGTTCAIPTNGNGPSNSVKITVVAINAIGESEPVTLADPVWSDIIPVAPSSLSASPLDHGLRLTWNAVPTPARGTAVDRYRVVVGGFETTLGLAQCNETTCTWDTPSTWVLDNGVAVSYTVSARNAAYTALSVWNTSEPRSAVPAGPPIASSAPVATPESDTSVKLSWSGVFNNNGRSVTAYTAAAYTGTPPTCSPSGTITSNGAKIANAGTSSNVVLSGLTPNRTYTLVVFADNGQGCTASSTVVAHTPPAVITALDTSGPVANGKRFDFTVNGGSMGADSLDSDYTLYYRLSGGSVPGTVFGPVALGSFLTAEGGQHYGNDLSVQVRACKSYGSAPICQTDWSASFPLGTAVDPSVGNLTFTSDNDLLNSSGTFTWLNWPSGNYENVQYRCGGITLGPWQTADTSVPGQSCHADVVLLAVPTLLIRVTANGGQIYERTYNGYDYD
ncbi:Ig-like domain-containing protein [Salinibacterium sp. SWN1162]|uniref:Ig-like domain-containing protein n=1 Tax=Salinibacterium sp. SWN1162 TaxID=2792053 RepID=UPI0018CCF376|nr:Ig-like domain-containing protein [Salinibacterium sp. SWN1162]MBH0010319.1 tandem-95 repeat protein [Salinibacterium sp. SWN1162]